MENLENTLNTTNNILLCPKDPVISDDIDYLKENFCGTVVQQIGDMGPASDDTIIYIIGDIGRILGELNKIENNILYVIRELSYNFTDLGKIIGIGEVPINVHNVGVFFRNFFGDKDYFDSLTKEHRFQLLTESNKPGTSYRKGLYITKVCEDDEGINFNLLRCSTNLDGPTDNFRQSDHEIVDKVNEISKHLFEKTVPFNHVLAQVYNNVTVDGKERKAKIKQHSDKTKDMPVDGLMAFCTFYQFDENSFKEVKRSVSDSYDFLHKKGSVLTRLRFRLKKSVNNPNLIQTFDVVLYPNSVFLMSLSANRLYTHEIIPSSLPIDKLPTRMGYVIRCSKTKAVFRDDQTLIDYGDELIELQQPVKEYVRQLKNIYFRENISDQLITYPRFNFSLNQGDYLKPNV